MAGRGTIVVGVDGSADARRALEWAVAAAVGRRNLVLAVHAWTLGPMADFAWQSRRVLRRESVALLRATIRDAVRLGAEVEFGWSSVEGDAATVLLEAAGTAELLVLAARHGAGPADRPLGSVTARCVCEAMVPVVIVPRPVLRHHERAWAWLPSSMSTA